MTAITGIKVPPLGESVVEATVSRWTKREGEAVAAGDTLVELETDKITVEVPALAAGTLVKRLKVEGDVVTVGELLGEIGEAGAAAPASVPASVPASAAAPTPVPAPAGTAPVAVGAGTPAKVSPAAQRVAAESGVELATVTGTGRGGVVSKPDVLAAAKAAPVAAPTPSPTVAAPTAQAGAAGAAGAAAAGLRETREKMSVRRKRIAENLLLSQHATATLTTFNEIDMLAVTELRDRWKDRVEKQHGVKLTFMPFFAKAACMALADYPMVNASVDGDHVVYHHYVNLGIAVASAQGLVVPAIKDAHAMSMVEFTKALGAVAKRVRDGKLAMDDLLGGTFTITNGGVFGSLLSTPIVNFPQSAILGLHKTQDRPVVVQGQVVVRPMMYVALSYDHRIIDGEQAVKFLVRVKELMEDPAGMVVG
ncbi:MAG: 2-oxoglutarate dehydrogenase complex dihydrolipoyllysine-residue succinyltransferase [Gemmatimonadota bacterium]